MNLPRLKKWAVVLIEWEDSCAAGFGWGQLDEHERTCAGMVSVGLLEDQQASKVTLVQSRDATSGHVCQAITIPTACITSYRRLS